jgi:TRAP-type C4-dicarboxylate transport system permease small subunit
MNFLRQADSAFEKMTTWILVFILLAMMILSFLGIILRPFEITFTWLDPLIRHMVFVSCFLGGSLATSQGSHIAIDAAGRVFEHFKLYKTRWLMEKVVALSTIIILYQLMKSGLAFVEIELEFGKESFLGIHSGELVKIIPYGFFLIGIRFLFKFLIGIKNKEEIKN